MCNARCDERNTGRRQTRHQDYRHNAGGEREGCRECEREEQDGFVRGVLHGSTVISIWIQSHASARPRGLLPECF